MNDADPFTLIKSTLNQLDATEAYVMAFQEDIKNAFKSGAIPEVQFKYMHVRVERFLNKIALYKSVFTRIRDAYTAVE